MTQQVLDEVDNADALADETEVVAVELHPRAIRWMHWFNFPILSVMIWSGLRIYWSFDFTRVPGEFGDNNLLPNLFYEAADLDRSLARGLSFHLSFGWLFVINGLFYVIYLAFSKEWKHIVPRLSDLKNIKGTMMHEVGMNDEMPDHGQYNVMQQLAYTTVIVMSAIIVATGFALFKPTQLWWLTRAFGGYETARAIHFLMTAGLVGFFFIHIFQVARAGFENFWAMITGYKIEKVPASVSESTTESNDTFETAEITKEEELTNV